MNDYELMVIFTPVLSDKDFKSGQKEVEDFIKENGGKTVHTNPWGLRSLAYPIQKKTTGLYWVYEFQAPSELNDKLKIKLNRDEGVLRYMITRLDKYAVKYNESRKNKSKIAEPARNEEPQNAEA